MIQVVLMEKRDMINEYKQFRDNEFDAVSAYIRLALINNKHTTIQITKWDDKTRERL